MLRRSTIGLLGRGPVRRLRRGRIVLPAGRGSAAVWLLRGLAVAGLGRGLLVAILALRGRRAVRRLLGRWLLVVTALGRRLAVRRVPLVRHCRRDVKQQTS